MSEPLSFPSADDHDVLIIIPTVGSKETLLPTIARLATRLDGKRVRVVVALNPLSPDAATPDDVFRAWLGGMNRAFDGDADAEVEGVEVLVWDGGRPFGFSGAINRGLLVAAGQAPGGKVLFRLGERYDWGVPPVTIVFNDDLLVAHGWLDGLCSALDTEVVHLYGEIPDADGAWICRPAEHYGRIGMAGPVSNCAGGGQAVTDDGITDEIRSVGIDQFAENWRQRYKVINSTVFLSGLCTAFTRDCLLDLLITCKGNPEGPSLYDEDHYPIAGFEDNDISHRADLLGWRSVIDSRTFILHTGHQTFKKHFPEMQFGLRNRLAFYERWAKVPKGERLVAVYRVRFDVPFDLDLFRMSLSSVSTIVDGVAVLLTGPINRITASDEWDQRVSGDVQSLVLAAQERGDVPALADWVRRWTSHRPGNRAPMVEVAGWMGEANERHERNAAIEMGERLDADWILSVDHDEAIEPRVNRGIFERMMRHPDPLVRAWDFCWVNHWGDQRMVNVTRPWGDGGTYTGGMRGFRMFRVNHAAPRRIQSGTENGLHCGNVPLFCPVSIKTSAVRFRHFGYMRPADRARKLDRYRTVDPNPDAGLIGGSNYDHIGLEENQTMSAFYPVNGIGLHMLVHDPAQFADLGRNLDLLYGVTDRIVLVWTGPWTATDRAGLFDEAIRFGPNPAGVGAEQSGNLRATHRLIGDVEDPADWPSTGPSRALAKLAAAFGAEWVSQPLNNDFAAARNAGIDALHGTPGLGWAVFVDPDEYLPASALVALRRMAEATDAWGWMVRFRNQTGPGENDWSHSENVRMSRLDEHGVMRLNGRVHESFSGATRSLQEAGKRNIVRVCPVEWTNPGLALSPEAMERKVARYRELTEMMLRENPHQAGPWITLGLFWANEGANGTHMECLTRAMACAKPGEYLPFYEAGRLYMRLALACLSEAPDRMGGHPDRRIVEQMIDFLQTAAPPVPRTGLVASGGREPIPDDVAIGMLPPFPEIPVEVPFVFEPSRT